MNTEEQSVYKKEMNSAEQAALVCSRRRPLPSRAPINGPRSPHIHHIVLIICLLTAGRVQVKGSLSPVSLGIRSALANRLLVDKVYSKKSAPHQRQAWLVGKKVRVHQASSSLPQVGNSNDADDDIDDSLVESAFFRSTSQRDLVQIRSTDPAIARAAATNNNEKNDGPQSELELLESQVHPCSRTKTISNIAAPAASSNTATTSVPSLRQQQQPGKVSFVLKPQRQHQSLLEAVDDDIDLSSETLQKLRSVQAVTNQSPVTSSYQQQQQPSSKASSVLATTEQRGGAKAAVASVTQSPLNFWENMVCGAVSRSVAQTVMHPANTMKTILQSQRGSSREAYATLLLPSNFRRLTQGAGANFLLSVPHGAVNFAVLEFVRTRLAHIVQSTPFLNERSEQLGAGLDFLSSCISTITCSIISTPQMMITDNIMAGNYPNLPVAIQGLWTSTGLKGFYQGWWPGLVGKIPSYALTWTFFQQLKVAHYKVTNRPAKDIENSIMGSIASATTVCIMIPMDTIKTRLVTQTSSKIAPELAYKGIIDCAVRVYREEGLRTFYRGLPPRLVSVVPMIGIQFGVYEFAKRIMLERRQPPPSMALRKAAAEVEVEREDYGREQVLEEAAMEVAASPEQPYPAPQFHIRIRNRNKKKKKEKAKTKE